MSEQPLSRPQREIDTRPIRRLELIPRASQVESVPVDVPAVEPPPPAPPEVVQEPAPPVPPAPVKDEGPMFAVAGFAALLVALLVIAVASTTGRPAPRAAAPSAPVQSVSAEVVTPVPAVLDQEPPEQPLTQVPAPVAAAPASQSETAPAPDAVASMAPAVAAATTPAAAPSPRTAAAATTPAAAPSPRTVATAPAAAPSSRTVATAPRPRAAAPRPAPRPVASAPAPAAPRPAPVAAAPRPVAAAPAPRPVAATPDPIAAATRQPAPVEPPRILALVNRYRSSSPWLHVSPPRGEH